MHTVQVRWSRPTFVTYFTLAVYWGLSTGIALGMLGMATSLLGVLAWGGRGVAGGVAGFLWWPILLAMFSTLDRGALSRLSPGGDGTTGPKAAIPSGRRVIIAFFATAAAVLRVKLSAMYGFLLALLPALIVAVTTRFATRPTFRRGPAAAKPRRSQIAGDRLLAPFLRLLAGWPGCFPFSPFAW